jgi:hypothetical protein
LSETENEENPENEYTGHDHSPILGEAIPDLNKIIKRPGVSQQEKRIISGAFKGKHDTLFKIISDITKYLNFDEETTSIAIESAKNILAKIETTTNKNKHLRINEKDAAILAVRNIMRSRGWNDTQIITALGKAGARIKINTETLKVRGTKTTIYINNEKRNYIPKLIDKTTQTYEIKIPTWANDYTNQNTAQITIQNGEFIPYKNENKTHKHITKNEVIITKKSKITELFKTDTHLIAINDFAKTLKQNHPQAPLNALHHTQTLMNALHIDYWNRLITKMNGDFTLQSLLNADRELFKELTNWEHARIKMIIQTDPTLTEDDKKYTGTKGMLIKSELQYALKGKEA